MCEYYYNITKRKELFCRIGDISLLVTHGTRGLFRHSVLYHIGHMPEREQLSLLRLCVTKEEPYIMLERALLDYSLSASAVRTLIGLIDEDVLQTVPIAPLTLYSAECTKGMIYAIALYGYPERQIPCFLPDDVLMLKLYRRTSAYDPDVFTEPGQSCSYSELLVQFPVEAYPYYDPFLQIHEVCSDDPASGGVLVYHRGHGGWNPSTGIKEE